MTRTTALRLLALQTVLMVLVLWGGAYFARDEFQLATEAEEEEVETAQHAEDDGQGPPRVRLGETARRLVGLELATAEAGRLEGGLPLRFTVLDPRPLPALQAEARRLDAARREAEALVAASRAEARRLRGLHADEQQVSAQAVEAAEARAAVDAARRAAAVAAQSAQAESVRAAWGPVVGGWVLAADGSPGAGLLRRIGRGEEVLMRAPWPNDRPWPEGGRLVWWLPRPAGPADGPRPEQSAELIGPAPAAAAGETAPGLRPLLVRAPGAGLSPGLQLSGRAVLQGEAEAGAWVPASALVWHAGQAWVYAVQPGDGPAEPGEEAASAPAADVLSFRRVPVAAARREPGVGGRWFLPGFAAGTVVVVRGAQVLLSEEQKGSLKNENDD